LNPRIIGVDVGAGGDATCECMREGPLNRIMHEDHNPDTMQTCGNIVVHLEEWDADEARIDSIGIGLGVVNRGQELKKPFIGVNVGEAAEGEIEETDVQGNIQVVQASTKFINKRAQYYWQLREKFERGDIAVDPHDLQLAKELREIRFKRTSSGKIQIESKDDIKKRLNGQSCNRAEALMLANAEVPEEYQSLTW
jgi:phage terminase large subunit